MKYEEAYEELSTILKELQEDQISVDDLTEKVERATELIKVCSQKLRNTETSIEGIIKDLGL